MDEKRGRQVPFLRPLVKIQTQKSCQQGQLFKKPKPSTGQSTYRLKITALGQRNIQKTTALIGALDQNFTSFSLEPGSHHRLWFMFGLFHGNLSGLEI
jgi:hypothetical protein